MLLKQLRLQNIRSYVDETITFPRGTSLLSGDIGCGKSSILLAVEFALFGTSRPDLPAESLLRKGADYAAVELTFQLQEKEITIRRNLRKDTKSIKQIPGYLIVNNDRKELTPVELKAEILQLLQYPEDLLSKNKNYLFRYTVYTPQEEMKYILHENAELRLDVLRKIFNIDKYKIVRENIQIYLKKMRLQIAALQARIEPLAEEQKRNNMIVEERKNLLAALHVITPEHNDLQQKITQCAEQIKALEEQMKQREELNQKQHSARVLHKELLQQLEEIKDKIQQFDREVAALALPEESSREMMEQELKKKEEMLQQQVQKKLELQQGINHLQQKIKDQQQEIKQLDEALHHLPEKQAQHAALLAEVQRKQEIETRKAEIEDLLAKTTTAITKNQTVLEQARDIKQQINSLETCPSCLQIVPPEHKHKIDLEEEKKIAAAEVLMQELNQKRAEITAKLQQTREQLETISAKEKLGAALQTEIQQLIEKQGILTTRKEMIRAATKENNQLMEELAQYTVERRQSIEAEIKEQKEKLQHVARKEYIQQEKAGLQKKQQEKYGRLQVIIEELADLELKIKTSADRTPEIDEKRTSLHELQQKEKTAAVEEARLQERLATVQKQEQESTQRITMFMAQKRLLKKQQELFHWLETFFINLAQTIEKHVMVTVHRHFNRFFQEWFSILIDDENIHAWIDDAFSPVIEQNGYEISFANLSGGEKTSAALAYRLALNRVINDIIHNIKTKDLLILDEPTDGFSREQLDKVRDVLERLGLQQTIIVSHEAKIESFVSHILRVQKQGHVSQIIY